MEKSENLIKKLSSEGPMVIGHGSNLDNSLLHSLTQLAFNYKFINLIGENLQNFPLRLFKKGIPECIWIDWDYFQTINILINQAFCSDKLEEKIELLIKSKYKNLRAKSTSFITKFNEDNYSEIFVIQMFEINKNDMQWIQLNNFESNKKRIANHIRNEQNITNFNIFNLILEAYIWVIFFNH